MGGAIASSANMKSLQKLAYWYNCDNQGRGGGFEPVWGASLQGRVCDAMMNGRTATNVTGSYTTGSFRWRNIHKSTEEAQMWMNETVASGMVPWYHFIGAEEGLGADRRWQQPGHDYFNWLAKHDAHFTTKGTIADMAVVMGQRTQRFYKPVGPGDTMTNIHGLYQALLEGRFVFDFIHEEDLPTDKIKKYTTLILPNIALLSDAECAALQKFVADGGSVMASFETGLATTATSSAPSWASPNCSTSRHWARTRHGWAMASWRGSSGSIPCWKASATPTGCRARSIFCRWRR